VPSLETFKPVLEATAEGREISTTQAYVRFLSLLLRDKALGPRVVPILVDEARTFGMEGLFRQIGIYNPEGQKYTPVDKDQVMYYREDKAGQILQEGINEAGGMASWIAAATSYSTNNRIMVPFYVYYSMFGFQRIGDLAWAAGDMQARGFLLGGTSGRTTLNGEGLQHEDGHSHILAGTIPNCISYDPTFRARGGGDPAPRPEAHGREAGQRLLLPDAAERELPDAGPGAGHRGADHQGHVPAGEGCRPAAKGEACASTCWAAAPSCARASIAARQLLASDWGVAANVWSCPSFNELARDGQDCERWNLLHPDRQAPCALRHAATGAHDGPVVASTDYMKNYAEQIRAFIPKGRAYKVLGTDGFGRSDFRSKLREHFEINRHYIVVAALKALAERVRCRQPRWPRRSRSTASTPTSVNPLVA
jgi:pyruvate dehydrogenase E1 component